MTLAGGTVSVGTAGRFAAVGLFGLAIDALLFQFLMSRGFGLALAHITSFFAAAVINYSLNSRRSFQNLAATCDGSAWPLLNCRHIRVTAARRRTGPADRWLAHALVSGYLPGHCHTAAINYFGAAFYVFPVTVNPPSPDVRWRVASVGIVAFAVLLRLIYLGTAELIPDEAYYWNYAQHMDLSFYDHPPMVAWLIWLGTAIFGNTEFGFGSALCCGLITMATCMRWHAICTINRPRCARCCCWRCCRLVLSLPHS